MTGFFLGGRGRNSFVLLRKGYLSCPWGGGVVDFGTLGRLYLGNWGLSFLRGGGSVRLWYFLGGGGIFFWKSLFDKGGFCFPGAGGGEDVFSEEKKKKGGGGCFPSCPEERVFAADHFFAVVGDGIISASVVSGPLFARGD